MASRSYCQDSPNDGYPAPHGSLAPGFLSPPAQFEGRRDSVASSQSSYCQSFASSDYSVPATPTDHSFVDVMSYDMGPEFHGQSIHALPPPPSQKMSDSTYEPWMMVQVNEPVSVHALQFDPQEMLPTSRDYGLSLQAYDGDNNMGDVSVPSSAVTWENMSTIVNPDMDRYRQFLGRQERRYPQLELPTMENVSGLWNSTMAEDTQQQSMVSETMAPADVMMGDYVLVHPEGMSGTNTYDESSQSYPHSPQEVSFKREISSPIKEESDNDEGIARLRDRMYVSPTGGKSVKRERRSSGSVKKRSKAPKNHQYRMELAGTEIFCSVEPFKKEKDGKCYPIGGPTRTIHECEHSLPDGRPCLRRFKRPEHLKRHAETHTGRLNHHCKICFKGFGRNDNCQAHYDTHIRRAGKKDGRNKKMSLREVEDIVAGDAKLIEKLRQKHGCGEESTATM